MLKTKSIYKSKERGDGKRILVSRLHPRGIKKSQYDTWLKELSPSMDLIHEYKNNEISWKKFFSKYKKELKKNPKTMKTLNELRKKSKTHHITFLCFEPDGVPCHRHVLRDILKKPKLLNKKFVPKFIDT